jgi:carbonic anhydrase/acetyltransferase-like protein (isoleucine patch superfamily)
MKFEIQFRPDQIDPTAYLAPQSIVLGNVWIGAESSVWFGAVIRGDTEEIRIGRQTNVQDLCVVHADPGYHCILGERVTIGHQATIHGAIVEDEVLVGMRAILLNGCKIGSGSVIAAGTLVPEGMEIPPQSVAMGVPAKVRRAAEARDLDRIRHAADHYVEAARAYRLEL